MVLIGAQKRKKDPKVLFSTIHRLQLNSVNLYLERETGQSPVIYPLEILEVWPTSAIPMDKILDYFEGVGNPVLSTALHSPITSPEAHSSSSPTDVSFGAWGDSEVAVTDEVAGANASFDSASPMASALPTAGGAVTLAAFGARGGSEVPVVEGIAGTNALFDSASPMASALPTASGAATLAACGAA